MAKNIFITKNIHCINYFNNFNRVIMELNKTIDFWLDGEHFIYMILLAQYINFIRNLTFIVSD